MNLCLVVLGLMLASSLGSELQAQTRVKRKAEICIPVQKDRDNVCRVDTVKVYVRDTIQLQGRVEYRDRFVTRYDTVYVKERNCWKTGRCELYTAAVLAAGALTYMCVTDWCVQKIKNENVNVNRNGMTAPPVTPYVGRSRSGGWNIGLNLPFSP